MSMWETPEPCWDHVGEMLEEANIDIEGEIKWTSSYKGRPDMTVETNHEGGDEVSWSDWSVHNRGGCNSEECIFCLEEEWLTPDEGDSRG